MKHLEDKITNIEARNKKVEADKAWETSYTRRILVAVFTYIVMVMIMNSIGAVDPWISAIVPTIGFILSTVSLPVLKDVWLKYIYKK